MRGTIYFKKWTRMPWWSRLYHIRNQTPEIHDPFDRQSKELYNISLDMDRNFKDFLKNIKTTGLNPKSKKKRAKLEKEEIEKDDYFIKMFFNKYPQLMNTTWGWFDEEKKENEDNQSYKILNSLYRSYQKKLNDGYTEEKATEIVLRKYDDQIYLRLEEISRTENLAISNRSLNLMDYFQNHKIQESNYKTNQLLQEKDLDEFENLEEIEEFDQSYKLVKPDYEMEDVNNFLENQISGKSQKLEKETIDNFCKRSKNLFLKYYDDQAMFDRLEGLNNVEILRDLRHLPSSLKKHFGKFNKFLDKHNICLNELGEVDFKNCEDKNVLKRLQKDLDKIKYSLMLRDLHYGFPHRKEYEQKLGYLQKELANYNKEALENIKNINEEKKKKKLESLQFSKSQLDEKTGYTYYIQKRINDEDLQEKISDKKLGIDEYINGIYGKIDWKHELVENKEERTARLEVQWLEESLIDKSIEYDSEGKVIENKKSEILFKKLKDSIEKLRLLKLKLDKKSFNETKKIFYDENKNLDFDNLDVTYDELKDYFTIPKNNITANLELEKDYNQTLNVIERPILRKDLINPFETPILDFEDGENTFWTKTKVEKLKKKSLAEQPVFLDSISLIEEFVTPESNEKFLEDLKIKDEKTYEKLIDKREKQKERMEKVEEARLKKLEDLKAKSKDRKRRRKKKKIT